MKLLRVVLTGSESTGKTTLARALAVRQDATWSPEFARDYLERKAAPLTADDVEPIARGQRAAEDAAARSAREMVFLDTDLISTVLYARHYYGGCPCWIEREARARRGDLYLLHHPDVAWEPDGLQRDRGEKRAEMHELFVRTLEEFEVPVVEVAGPWPERWRRATEAVDRLRAEIARARTYTPGPRT